MFDGIFTPEFLQAACAHPTPLFQNTIKLHIGADLGELYAVKATLSYIDDVNVEYVQGGVTKTMAVTGESFEFKPDAYTDVIITGNVTRFNVGAPPNGIIEEIDAAECKTLMSLTTSPLIKTLKISKYLTSLDIRGTSITSIYYPANNNSVSTEIADAITNASTNNGTVYTKSTGTYYNTIADAATAKGWTIHELN